VSALTVFMPTVLLVCGFLLRSFLLKDVHTLLMIFAIVVQAGRALGDLKSVRELYDFKTLVVLFLIGSVAVAPTILKRKRTYE
jgi:hypothetical protein